MSPPIGPAPAASTFWRDDLHPIPEPLYVVTMLSNPLKWRSRYWNYRQFEHEMAAAGATLYTAEIAFGARPHEVTTPGNPTHLQLRTSGELWHKENALNLLIQRLPANARYIAWIDADIQFARPDWVQETIQQLQHYPVIQMFSQAQDMADGYSAQTAPAHGFAYCHVEQLPQLARAGRLTGYPGDTGTSGVYWHPGFAWAMRREALDAVGGLLDMCIVGSADWHMASALVGRVQATLGAGYTRPYIGAIEAWAERAERYIRRDVGYLPGLVLHHYHGNKALRGYNDRASILRDFDPGSDLVRDWQGLWQLNPERTVLRDQLRRYNRRRQEDS